MTRQELFRPEAVAHHARGRSAGRVVDLTDRTAARAFAALLLALALVTALAVLVRVDESASGAAVASGRDAVLLLPIGAATRLHTGQEVDLVLGARHIRARLGPVLGPIASADAQRRYGVGSSAPAVVLARATLPPGTAAGRGTATVVLGRRSVAGTLLRRS